MAVTQRGMLALVTSCLLGIVVSNNIDGMCKTSNNAYNYECCANYYIVNLKCEKCPDGQQSQQGDTSCSVCDKGYWGPNCAETCKCDQNNCDPINGTCLIERRLISKYTESNTTPNSNRNSVSSTSYLLYGSAIGVSLFSIVIVTTAVFAVVKCRQNTCEQDTNQQMHYSGERSTHGVNEYAVNILADEVIKPKHLRKSISMPEFIATDTCNMYGMCNLAASSESCIRPYDTLQVGWEKRKHVYDKPVSSFVNTENKAMSVTADIHSVNDQLV